ncbi:MAG: hypothetical protein ABIH86_06275 [Planctomycetota bacterium]
MRTVLIVSLLTAFFITTDGAAFSVPDGFETRDIPVSFEGSFSHFSSDRIVGYDGIRVIQYDISDAKTVVLFEPAGTPDGVCVTATLDQKYVLFASADGSVYRYSVESMSSTIISTIIGIEDIAFDSDGVCYVLATGSTERIISAFDIETGVLDTKVMLSETGAGSSICFNPDGDLYCYEPTVGGFIVFDSVAVQTAGGGAHLTQADAAQTILIAGVVVDALVSGTDLYISDGERICLSDSVGQLTPFLSDPDSQYLAGAFCKKRSPRAFEPYNRKAGGALWVQMTDVLSGSSLIVEVSPMAPPDWADTSDDGDPWADSVPGLRATGSQIADPLSPPDGFEFYGQYTPIGIYVNNGAFNNPERAVGRPYGSGMYAPNNTSVVSLGQGGHIILYFKTPVVDDPRNAYGLDFILFGNAFWMSADYSQRWLEPAYVEIAQDKDGDGLYDPVIDGPFYLILPKPQPTELVAGNTTGQCGGMVSGYADANPTLMLGDLDGDNAVDDETMDPIDFYTTPDRPDDLIHPESKAIDPGSGGGDAFDIADAVVVAGYVNTTAYIGSTSAIVLGQPVIETIDGTPYVSDGTGGEPVRAGIRSFQFMRIVDAKPDDEQLGEVSAEICAAADIEPLDWPPAIYDIEHSVTGVSLTVCWATDMPAAGRIDYGETTAYGRSATAKTYALDHCVVISKLKPNADYHFRIVATDRAGQTDITDDVAFSTGTAVDEKDDTAGRWGCGLTLRAGRNKNAGLTLFALLAGMICCVIRIVRTNRISMSSTNSYTKRATGFVALIMISALLIGCSRDDPPSRKPTYTGLPGVFVVSTDFAVSGNYATVDLSSSAFNSYVNSTPYLVHSDASAAFNDPYIFIINRKGADNITVLDPRDGMTLVKQFSVGAGANPQSIAFVSDDEIWITLYDRNEIGVYHPLTGGLIETINLSDTMFPDHIAHPDTDGYVEPSGALYHNGLVYIAVQRLNRGIAVPGLWGPLGKSYVAVFDPATRSLTETIELPYGNPTAELQYNVALDRIIVVCPGVWHDDLWPEPIGGGLVAIDPATNLCEVLAFEFDDGTSALVNSTGYNGNLNDVAILSETRGFLLLSDSEFNESVHYFDPATGWIDPVPLVSASGFNISKILISSGYLLIADRTLTASGIWIFDASIEQQLTSTPIPTGAPPYHMTAYR